jgi:hypothetical protein
MSHPHTVNGDTHVDVINTHQTDPLPAIASPPPLKEYAVDPVVVSSRETAKSVKVSAGKRRKVIDNYTSIPQEARKTRFGGAKPQINNSDKSAAPKYRTAEEIKNVTKSAYQKRLHKTFELHDTKVRELFHLTKFVTLVDYDAKAAKQDESEVFKEVISRNGPTKCSSKKPTNYGRRLRMQNLVGECVLRDMPSTIRKMSLVLHSQLHCRQNLQRQQLRSQDPNDPPVLIPLFTFHRNEVDGV